MLVNHVDIAVGDLGRLVFGHGIHYCIGAHLASAELTIAARLLAERVERIEPAGEPTYESTCEPAGESTYEPTYEPTYERSFIVRDLRTLPVRIM